MIRHIVFFKLKEGISKKEADGFVQELLDLKKHIAFVRDIEVCRDEGRKHNSYDLALNSLFDTMEHVEEYAIHPAHVKVLETVKKLCDSTVKVDYPTVKVAI